MTGEMSKKTPTTVWENPIYKKKPKKELQKKGHDCFKISLAQKRNHVTQKRANQLRAQEPVPES